MRGFDSDPLLTTANLRQHGRILLAEHFGIGSPLTRLAVQAEVMDDLNPESADPEVSPTALLKLLGNLHQARTPARRYQMLADPIIGANVASGTGRVWFDAVEGLTNTPVIQAVAETLRDLSSRSETIWERVIDLGSGTGQLGSLLQGGTAHSAVATSVTLVDRTSELLAVAAHRNGPAMQYVTSDVLHLPFADQTFDAATSGGLTYSLGRDLQDDYFCEVHRILKPGGVYVDGDRHDWQGTTDNFGRFQLSWLIKCIVSGKEVLGNPLAGEDSVAYFSKLGLQASYYEYPGGELEEPISIRVLGKPADPTLHLL